jgi:uncharacterized protein
VSNGTRPSLDQRVSDLVAWLFKGFEPRVPRGPKVINDALLGNQYFAKHEVAVIDTPLLQRLRRIKQTGLAYHVYPTAQHTRYDHSLGVATLADRCFAAIRQRALLENDQSVLSLLEGQNWLSGDLAHLRMAALLHDTGHGLCSHTAEQIYEAYTDLEEFTTDQRFIGSRPGEILSYLMVKSEAFSKWFQEIVVDKCGAKLDLEVVANLILGRAPTPEKFFLAQIISSPYDADKLDYIARDSYFCGLALTVDLPRFYSMIATTEIGVGTERKRVLVLRSYVPLEQILFSKMMLYGSVYHHQKVKCIDHMLRATILHIKENKQACAVSARGVTVSFQEPVEFLYVTDDEFFNQFAAFGDAFVVRMCDRFRRRDLLVRCVELSRRTLPDWENEDGIISRTRLVQLSKKPQETLELEEAIYNALPAPVQLKCQRGEILLSVPSPPDIKPEHAFIQESPKAEPREVSRYFPVEEWNSAYAVNKWRSFVYCPRAVAKEVAAAAGKVLSDTLKLKIDFAQSNQACRIE